MSLSLRNFLLGLLLLGGCGFLADNDERSLRNQMKENQSNGNCEPISDFSNQLSAPPAEFAVFVDCHFNDLEKTLENVRGHKPEELSLLELRALLNAFYFDDKPLDKLEVKALLSLRDLINPGNEERLHYREFSEIANYLKRVQEDLRSLISGRDWEMDSPPTTSESILALLSQVKYRNEALDHDEFFGLVQFGSRFLKGDLAYLAENLNSESSEDIYALVKNLLGFGHLENIPYRSLNNAEAHARNLRDLRKIEFRLSNLEDEDFNEIFDTLNLFSEYRLISERSIDSFLALTGYHQGGALRRDEFNRILGHLSAKTWKVSATKALDLNLDAEVLTRMLFESKNSLVGRGSQQIGQMDLKRLGEHYFTIERSQLWPISVSHGDLKNREIRELVHEPQVLEFMDQHWNHLLAQSPTDTRIGGQVFLDLSTTQFYLQSLVTSLLKSYDENGNGILDVTQNSQKDEFKKILKTTAALYTGLKIYGDDKEESTSEFVRESRDQNKAINALIDDPKAFYSLVFYADNFGYHSNGDGAINGAELSELIKLIESHLDFKNSLNFRADEVRPELRPFMSYRLLMLNAHPILADKLFNLVYQISDISVSRPGDGDERDQVLRAVFLSDDFEDLLDHLSIEEENLGTAQSLFNEIQDHFRPSDDILLKHLLAFGDKNIPDFEAITILAMAKAGANIFSKTHPYFYTEIEHLEGEDQWSDFDPHSDKAGRISFPGLKGYFSGRISGKSLSWLPTKMRMALLAAPKDLGPEISSRLIWNAADIRESLSRNPPRNEDHAWARELIAILQKAERDESRSIGYQELAERMNALALSLISLSQD